jgi:hypothetical protein
MGATSRSPGAWRIEGLPADGPFPELAGKLALFGQFVGDWDILECRSLEDDGTWSTSRGKLHWRWIIEGRAVQDIWTTIDESTGRSIPVGTTLRFYDPRIDAWHSVWISPAQGVVRPFVGRSVGSEIVLEGRNSRDNPIRWIFSEITPTSFRWQGEELRNPPSGWVLYEEMRIRRTPTPK